MDNTKKKEYNAKYDALNMKTFSVKMNNDLYNKLENAFTTNNINRNKYVTIAITEKLKKEGYL